MLRPVPSTPRPLSFVLSSPIHESMRYPIGSEIENVPW
jgi:hypothetical protein